MRTNGDVRCSKLSLLRGLQSETGISFTHVRGEMDRAWNIVCDASRMPRKDLPGPCKRLDDGDSKLRDHCFIKAREKRRKCSRTEGGQNQQGNENLKRQVRERGGKGTTKRALSRNSARREAESVGTTNSAPEN